MAKATWIASVSDGKRLDFVGLVSESIENPWDRVIDYIKTKGLYLTHLELIVNGVRYNSPSFGKNSSFKSNEEVKSFWIYNKIATNLDGSGAEDRHICYSYRLGDYRHFYWVNTANNFSYCQVMNVVNPTNQEEESFKENEAFIDKMYN